MSDFLFDPLWHLLAIYLIGCLVTCFVSALTSDEADLDKGADVFITVGWPLLIFAIPVGIYFGTHKLGIILRKKIKTNKQARIAKKINKQNKSIGRTDNNPIRRPPEERIQITWE